MKQFSALPQLVPADKGLEHVYELKERQQSGKPSQEYAYWVCGFELDHIKLLHTGILCICGWFW